MLCLAYTHDRDAACGDAIDYDAQNMPNQQATQQQTDRERHQPWYDCQGLKLLTSDRHLKWERFVLQSTEAAVSNRMADCSFQQQAQTADVQAETLSGLVPGPDCLPWWPSSFGKTIT